MELEFDQLKNAINIAKHGLSFAQVVDLDWNLASTKTDLRNDYGEIRHLTYTLLNSRVCFLAWTMRGGKIRPISFRKAKAKERKRYETEKIFES